MILRIPLIISIFATSSFGLPSLSHADEAIGVPASISGNPENVPIKRKPVTVISPEQNETGYRPYRINIREGIFLEGISGAPPVYIKDKEEHSSE